jgi:hypothetical protein
MDPAFDTRFIPYSPPIAFQLEHDDMLAPGNPIRLATREFGLFPKTSPELLAIPNACLHRFPQPSDDGLNLADGSVAPGGFRVQLAQPLFSFRA